jgi:hypothetical protein
MFQNTGMTSYSHNFPKATTLEGLFKQSKVTTANITDTPLLTSATLMFELSPIVSVNKMDMPELINGNGMFQNCKLLVNHPGFIGEKVQDFSYMFNGCDLLETVGDMGMANATNVTGLFYHSPKVRSFTLRGLKVSIVINNLNLSAAALDAVFTSLGTANAGATINISGNPGAATCTKSIAVNKGWAVTG